MLNRRQLSSCRQWGLYVYCLLVAMSWKVCCLCVMSDKVATEDGWPSAIHTCKEDGKNRRLDED